MWSSIEMNSMFWEKEMVDLVAGNGQYCHWLILIEKIPEREKKKNIEKIVLHELDEI